jgi:hypothetical protein
MVNKSSCCDVEMRIYHASVYPYESGYKCQCCGAEFSDLQIARGALEVSSQPWGLCKSKDKHGWAEKEKKLLQEALLDAKREKREKKLTLQKFRKSIKIKTSVMD